MPKGGEREKGPEKIFEDIIAENILNMGKESHPSPGSTDSHRQDKPKKETTETQSNQVDKNQRQRNKSQKQQGKSNK